MASGVIAVRKIIKRANEAFSKGYKVVQLSRMQICSILPYDMMLQLFCLRFPFQAFSSSATEGPGPPIPHLFWANQIPEEHSYFQPFFLGFGFQPS